MSYFIVENTQEVHTTANGDFSDLPLSYCFLLNSLSIMKSH